LRASRLAPRASRLAPRASRLAPRASRLAPMMIAHLTAAFTRTGELGSRLLVGPRAYF
jgi:hypothetical protein